MNDASADGILPYFDRELAYLREVGAEFARAHPKIASRLRLGDDSVEDPHVARLVQSVALLNARTRKKLDDDFPEIASAILGAVAPHTVAPIPAVSVLQFECSPDLTSGFEIPRGTAIEADSRYARPCYFRTGYDAHVWPITIKAASVVGAPFIAPRCPASNQAASVLRMRIETSDGQCPMGELGLESLRFYIRGQSALTQSLLELVLDDALEVMIARSAQDPKPIRLGPKALRPVGFEAGDRMLPIGGPASEASSLLTEYFAMPEKFNFFDVVGLPQLDEEDGESGFESGFDLFILSKNLDRELEQAVSEESFALGCVPVINLCARRAEPAEIDGLRSEIPVVVDARNPEAFEVFEIDSVTAISREGGERPFQPFFGIRHPGEPDERGAYWLATQSLRASRERPEDRINETALSLVDLEGQRSDPVGWVLDVEATCHNGDAPSQLPFGGEEPHLRFSEGGGGIEEIRCLKPFSRVVRPSTDRGNLWRMVSQLSLNHLSISGGEAGADALREILRVSDRTDSGVTRQIIESIKSVESEPTMMRVRDGGRLGFVRGTEIRIELDVQSLAAVGAFQFGMVLNHFLAGYSATNSFIRLVTSCRKTVGGWRKWPARSGTRVML